MGLRLLQDLFACKLRVLFEHTLNHRLVARTQGQGLRLWRLLLGFLGPFDS
jgi:hypothetical protein